MDFSLLYIFLYYWLGDDLVGWYLNSFSSGGSVVLRSFGYSFHFYSLVWLSGELYVDIFSLDYWLYISLVVNFSSRSGDCLGSGSLLQNWLSHYWLLDFVLRFCLLKFNSFYVVNNLSLDNRLSVDFFGRSLDDSVDSLFIILNWSGLDRSVVNLSLTSVDLELNVFGQNSRLDILFSNGGFSGYVYRYCFSFDFTINNWLFVFSFSIYRSGDDLFSDDGSLYNSLFDDRLLDNSLSNNRLRNDFSSYYWLGYNLLSLGDDWLGVKYFSSYELGIGLVLSGFGLEYLSGLTLGSVLCRATAK